MEKLVVGRHTFEVVNYIPYGYKIWNLGRNMPDGYLPLVQFREHDYQVNNETLKTIRVEGAQTILEAIGKGQDTIKKMETYVKRYKNSKREVTQVHVQRLQNALKVMYTIKWE